MFPVMTWPNSTADEITRVSGKRRTQPCCLCQVLPWPLGDLDSEPRVPGGNKPPSGKSLSSPVSDVLVPSQP